MHTQQKMSWLKETSSDVAHSLFAQGAERAGGASEQTMDSLRAEMMCPRVLISVKWLTGDRSRQSGTHLTFLGSFEPAARSEMANQQGDEERWSGIDVRHDRCEGMREGAELWGRTPSPL